MENITKLTELTRLLEEKGVPLPDWSDDYSITEIDSAMVDEGVTLTLDILGSEGDQSIIAYYYSEKLRKVIIMEWDAYKPIEKYIDLAGYLLGLGEEARAFEESIKV